MITLYWLSQIESADRLWVGEKAWILSQLKKKGYPVFPGFVIGSETWGEFLGRLDDSTSLLADFPTSSLYFDVDNFRSLQLAAQQSRQAIVHTYFPDQWRKIIAQAVEQLPSNFLIVQGSLGNSLGIKQEFANLIVPQVCKKLPQDLELAIKQIWCQLLSAQSLFYGQRMDISIEKLNLGVLVQPLTNVIVSSIVTVSPKTFEIQATWGLPQSLWGGEVLPDRFVFDRTTSLVIDRELGNKTRAYRLENKDVSRDVNYLESPLGAYVLSSPQQEQYCLDESILSQIYPLLEDLSQDELSWSSLEWTWLESEHSQLPTLAITEIIPGVSSSQVHPLSFRKQPIIVENQPLLRGIGAAPGRTQGLIQIITGEIAPSPPSSQKSVIVTKEIHPSQLPLLKQAVGVITEQGGMTSHAAILARELNIPAVVGVSRATKLLKTGDSIILDGRSGTIYYHTSPQNDISLTFSLNSREMSSKLSYPIATQLMVNVSQPSSLVKAIDLPIDGIGLVRSELMLLNLCSPKSLEQWLHESEPTQIVEQICECIREFTTSFTPRPVFYRSFDGQSCQGINATVRGDCRGTASYLLNPTLFDWELRALAQVQAQGFHNLRLILPFVRSVAEFRFCRHRVEQAGLMESKTFELWIMAEVPSVLFELEEYVNTGVQGIAIGTNDLVPLLFGVERDNPEFSDTAQPCPIVLKKVLKQFIKKSHQLGISCSLCGQAASQYPDLVEDLVQWGITNISVETEAVERTYQAIARAEKKLLLEFIRQQRKN
ncbi:putative PEP-binding protein [cyanobacterium endosymbiont of Epithemia clementina EcSB]|uniref:putative PEP-binding protein n=1 Tax=cyanobacterium endosymbiont of Epithemia clementina EcSB TaxID=3034674 RepID=UPI0024815C6E|nr:putative PEP-binding protein [cyanobacterium endosymbiont of Epithemia clementina EcSB]WGT67530.1 PEP-utilizing enzyme [cyanobacterium endosymbiont of Epithemia clementina EcSB]